MKGEFVIVRHEFRDRFGVFATMTNTDLGDADRPAGIQRCVPGHI